MANRYETNTIYEYNDQLTILRICRLKKGRSIEYDQVQYVTSA